VQQATVLGAPKSALFSGRSRYFQTFDEPKPLHLFSVDVPTLAAQQVPSTTVAKTRMLSRDPMKFLTQSPVTKVFRALSSDARTMEAQGLASPSK